MIPSPQRLKMVCLALATLMTSILAFITAMPMPTAVALPVDMTFKAMLPRRVALFTTETEEAYQPCTTAVLDVLSHYRVGRMVFHGTIRGTLPLRGVNGGPLFSLIILCNWPGGLMSRSQKRQVAEYQREFNVRRVTFAADADDERGLVSARGFNGSCCDPGVEQQIRWFPPPILAEADIHFEKQVRVLNPMSSVGHWHTPATLLNRTVVTPVLAFEPLPDRFPKETLAAAVVRDEGAESLLFFFDMVLSQTAIRLGDLWIQWGLRSTKFVGDAPYSSKVDKFHQ